MLEVRIHFAKSEESTAKSIPYISYACPKCGKNIVSFKTLHKCYNCHVYVVSGGLLAHSPQYRFNYHIGEVGDDGNVYVGGVNANKRSAKI